MRIAFISDIHGNLEALTAVLAEIDRLRVDQVDCLGDIIGYGANPRECLQLVRQRCQVTIVGNHEHAVLGKQKLQYYNQAAKTATAWTRRVLTDEELEYISTFAMEKVDDDLHLVHASPYQPHEWHYVFTSEEAEAAFAHLKGKLGFCGHSHIPMIIVEMASEPPRCKAAHDFLPDPEGRYLINVGSVGQPRDNDPRACFTVFDRDEYAIEFHRVDYDIELAQQKMKQADLPEVLATRLAAGV